MLDAGCGSGATTREIAKVIPKGQASGVGRESKKVDFTRRKADFDRSMSYSQIVSSKGKLNCLRWKFVLFFFTLLDACACSKKVDHSTCPNFEFDNHNPAGVKSVLHFESAVIFKHAF